MIHPEFKKMISYLGKKKFDDSLIITNATLIDDEMAQCIAESGIPVQVSINGISADEHDVLCGKGNYEKTMTGLKRLREAGLQRIVIRCMVSSANIDYIEQFISKMAPMAENVLIGFLTEAGRGLANKEKIAVDSFKKYELIERLNNSEIVANIRKSGVKVSYPDECFNVGCPLIHESQTRVPLNPRIDADGNVYICQGFSDVADSVGNIHESSLHEILSSERLERYVNFLNLATENIHACNSCVWKKNCGKGCIAAAVGRGSVQETDGECDIRKYVFGKELIREMMQ